MYILISYDITNDRDRNRVMKFLKNYGVHAQKSVFECHLEEDHYSKVKQGLQKLIKPQKDSIRFYRICRACTAKVEISGWGTVR